MTDKTAPTELIRKVASALAFETLYELPPPTTEELIEQMKLASLEDVELFHTASRLSRTQDETFSLYESLGGKYKYAFGTPMFAAQQMAGSPAVAGGMARRASTPMPQPQQAKAPMSPATSSPRAQSQGSVSIPSATPQAAQAAPAPAPAAPAPSVSTG